MWLTLIVKLAPVIAAVILEWMRTKKQREDKASLTKVANALVNEDPVGVAAFLEEINV